MRTLFRTLTLPFRLAIAAVRLVIRIVGILFAMVMVPVRAVIWSIRRIVNLAADLTFLIWTAAIRLVKLVLGTVAFVVGAIWWVVRKVLGIPLLPFRLLGFGRRRRGAALIDAAI